MLGKKIRMCNLSILSLCFLVCEDNYNVMTNKKALEILKFETFGEDNAFQTSKK